MTSKAKAKHELTAMRVKREGAGVRTDPTLPTAPGINALSFATRYIPGGRKRFMEFVKFAALNGDPSAVAWWKVYSDLTPHARQRCNFDDICEAGGIRPSALIAGVVGHAVEASTDVGNLVAAVLHPEVIQAAGKSALRIDGEHADIAAEDRKQLLQARGFLPVPKGASTHLHVNAQANAQAVAASDPSLPNFAADVGSVVAPRNEVHRQITERPLGYDVVATPVPETTER